MWFDILDFCPLLFKDVLNRNLVRYDSHPEPGSRKSPKKIIKSTNKSEAIHFYGLTFLIEY